MKLKYNHGGEVQEIPLSTVKPQGKRLVIRHNDQNFYAPLVDAGDATASKLKTVYMGEVYAVRKLPPPEIENILIAPPRVSVMQGQSATATVSAEGNEAVAGLSFSIANNPTWITIADECILIQPSDNDLGEAIVEVIAKDTGSNASMSTAFVAEALLRPIITQLGIAPPAVTVGQGQSATALIEAVANSAVGGLSYSLDGAPSWIRNDNDTIWVEPTTNDVGTSTVNVVAYDPNSSARADTSFTAEAVMVPQIYGVTASPSTVTVEQGDSIVVTLAAEYNSAVTGIEYSLEGAPPWMTISGNLITVAPTTEDLGSVTVTITARDTGSGVQATTQITAEAQVVQPKISGITVNPAPQIKGSRVVAWQGNTLNYPLTCTANSAVTSVRYSLAPSENNPPWVSVASNKTLRAAPTTANSALGDTATVTLVAYDTGSTAQATTAVNVSVIEKPAFSGAPKFTPTTVTVYPGEPDVITITPPSVNSGVTGFEYSLSASPSWVTLIGNEIIAQPKIDDVSAKAINTSVSVQAVDTGSTIVSAKSTCRLIASLRPAISSVSVMPARQLKHSRVVGWQGKTLYYPLTCMKNYAVKNVRYSLAPSENNPAWLSVYNYASLYANPTTVNSALGDTATITIVAYDTGSTVQATTSVAASVSLTPNIGALTLSKNTAENYPEVPATLTISANPNGGVTGIEYELLNAPSWVSLQDDLIIFAPTENDTVSQAATIVAHDTGSTVQSSLQFVAEAQNSTPEIVDFSVNWSSDTIYVNSDLKATINAPHNSPVESITYGITTSNSIVSVRSLTQNNAWANAQLTLPAGRLTADSKPVTVTVTATDNTGTVSQEKTFEILASKRQGISISPDQRVHYLADEIGYGSGNVTLTIPATVNTSADKIYLVQTAKISGATIKAQREYGDNINIYYIFNRNKIAQQQQIDNGTSARARTRFRSDSNDVYTYDSDSSWVDLYQVSSLNQVAEVNSMTITITTAT